MPRKTAVHKATLNERQRAFARAFVKNGGNAHRAALEAGYKPGGAAAQGCRFAKNALVRAEIDKLRARVEAKAEEETGISLAKTLKALQRGVEFDARRLYNDDGSPKALSELDDDTAACIEGIESRDEYGIRDGERVITGRVIKYKIAGRKGFVELAMRHFGAFAKENEQQGKAAAGAVTALLAQMRGSTLPIARGIADGEEDVA